jgi:hypothetical protein
MSNVAKLIENQPDIKGKKTLVNHRKKSNYLYSNRLNFSTIEK